MKRYLVKSLLFYFLILSFLSCTTDEQNSVKESLVAEEVKEKQEVGKLMEQLGGELHFDSLRYDYSIQAKEMIGKKIFMDKTSIDDIYEDSKGAHIVLISHYNLFMDAHIDLLCTPEQTKYLLSGSTKNQRVYLTMIPETVERINQRLVANYDADAVSEEIRAYIELERNFFGISVRVTGRVLNIKLAN